MLKVAPSAHRDGSIGFRVAIIAGGTPAPQRTMVLSEYAGKLWCARLARRRIAESHNEVDSVEIPDESGHPLNQPLPLLGLVETVARGGVIGQFCRRDHVDCL